MISEVAGGARHANSMMKAIIRKNRTAWGAHPSFEANNTFPSR
jgi:hypothetical protein